MSMLLLLACTSSQHYTSGTVSLAFSSQEQPAVEASLEILVEEGLAQDSALYAGCEPGETEARGWVFRKLFDRPTGDVQLDLCLPPDELGLGEELAQAKLWVDAVAELPAEQNPATGGEEGRGTVTMALWDADFAELGGIRHDGTTDQLGEGWISMEQPDSGTLLATDLPFEWGGQTGLQTLRVEWELYEE